MTKASQSAVHWIDADARPVNPCAWCQHFEYLHANSGRCLFSECACSFFDPGRSQTAEASGDGQ